MSRPTSRDRAAPYLPMTKFFARPDVFVDAVVLGDRIMPPG
jgi:hypothetical protein